MLLSFTNLILIIKLIILTTKLCIKVDSYVVHVVKIKNCVLKIPAFYYYDCFFSSFTLHICQYSSRNSLLATPIICLTRSQDLSQHPEGWVNSYYYFKPLNHILLKIRVSNFKNVYDFMYTIIYKYNIYIILYIQYTSSQSIFFHLFSNKKHK